MAGRFRGFLAGALLFSAGTTACERHVRLEFPNAPPGEEFTCRPTTGQKAVCEPRTNINPADDNKANTVFVTLPPACQGRVHQITIHDSGSSEPVVNVRCAPPENKIPCPEPVACPGASSTPAPSTTAPAATPVAPAPH